MSATHRSANGGASAAIAQTVRTGRLLAIAPREPANERWADGDGPASGELGRLAEVVLPTDDHAPGAARIVIAHCLTGLVARAIVAEAQLLGSELVENRLPHARVDRGDTMFVRVHLGTETLRVEVEHQRTTVWFEMARA
jgi:hypothetical protein